MQRRGNYTKITYKYPLKNVTIPKNFCTSFLLVKVGQLITVSHFAGAIWNFRSHILHKRDHWFVEVTFLFLYQQLIVKKSLTHLRPWDHEKWEIRKSRKSEAHNSLPSRALVVRREPKSSDFSQNSAAGSNQKSKYLPQSQLMLAGRQSLRKLVGPELTADDTTSEKRQDRPKLQNMEHFVCPKLDS